MNSNIIRELREWAPLTDLLNKIPVKIQRNLFYYDLNITCFDVLSDFIALGSDAGIVFWYNRKNGSVQKLRSEINSPIVCVRIVSTVEFMVAAGSECGQVSVFQIQKELPADLNLIAPLTKEKPIQRYTIRDLHHSRVKCVDWSKNGMKLVSGDKNGVIVLTEFDFQNHLSKSKEILNEAYEIVQICFQKSWLLVSTVYRAIICEQEKSTVDSDGSIIVGGGQWMVKQIGKTDRKILSNFGVTFRTNISLANGYPQSQSPEIVCARPGFRLWLADSNGNVSQTILLKDAMAVLNASAYEIPLLNPGRKNAKAPTNFGECFMFGGPNHLITHQDNILYIIDLIKLKVVAVLKHLRTILDVKICNRELFILEGPRSLIRISDLPETVYKFGNNLIYNPIRSLLVNSTPTIVSISVSDNRENNQDNQQQEIGSRSSPQQRPPVIEFEVEDEHVISAEECFELPPIQLADTALPLLQMQNAADDEQDLLKQDKLFLEHCRKVQIYEKANRLGYDDTILFKQRKKSITTIQQIHEPEICVEHGQCEDKSLMENTTGTNKSFGIVEIGQQVDQLCLNTNNTNKITSTGNLAVTTTTTTTTNKPCLLDVSFCDGAAAMGPSQTISHELELKEKKLAELLKIEKISCETIKFQDNSIKLTPDIVPSFHYPIDYMENIRLKEQNHSTPLKKIHFLCDNNDDDDEFDQININEQKNDNILKQTTSQQQQQPPPSTDNNEIIIPIVKQMPNYMQIPNIWNINIIETGSNISNGNNNNDGCISFDEPELSITSEGSEWEFVDE